MHLKMKWQLKKSFLYIVIILAFEKSKNCVPENTFDLPYVSTSDINKIIKSLNVNKAKRPDGISAKFVKMSANVIDCHLANIINNDISLKNIPKC